MKTKVLSLTALLLLVSILLAVPGCSSTKTQSKQVTDLKIGVLPTISALPLFVADEDGYFKDSGLNVELINFSSALEQDAALQSKQIDGYFSDPVNAITMINGGVDMSIINSPYVSSATDRMFAILVSPGSNITSGAELRGVEVGIANATITEYLQDKMLEKAGLAQSDIEGQDVKQIPVRMQMMLSGQLKAALLPEPLATLAEKQGAKAVVSDTGLSCPETVITLSNALMKQDNTLKNRFLQALEKAAKQINSGSPEIAEIASTTGNIPEAIKGVYKIPSYPVNVSPTEAQLTEIQQWMIDKGILKEMLAFDRLVK